MSQNVDLDAFEENLDVSWGKVIARRNTFPFTCPKEWWQTKEGTPIEIHVGKYPGWALGFLRQFDPAKNPVFASASWLVTHSYDFMGEPFFYDNEFDGRKIPVPDRLAQMEEWMYKIAEKSDELVLITMVGEMSEKFNKQQAEITPESVKPQSTQETQN